MKFWVGVTDNNWFGFLSARKPEEVNFWQPSPVAPFRDASVGMPFLFKLKRPNNHIAGGGYFVTYSSLPPSLAWEVFREKNGAPSFEKFLELIEPLLPARGRHNQIGCTVLANPFFFDKEDWIPDPPGWASNIVRGKMFESTSMDGRAIWSQVENRLVAIRDDGEVGREEDSLVTKEPANKYGTPVMMKPRLGQASFRVLVTDAYKRRCAMTGENTLVALEAAHIVPYARDGDHDVSNGLLLRADFHRLFDVGLVSVTPDLRIRVSPRIRESWFNGKVYYGMDNCPLSVMPDREDMRPDRDRLKWHYEEVFQE